MKTSLVSSILAVVLNLIAFAQPYPQDTLDLALPKAPGFLSVAIGNGERAYSGPCRSPFRADADQDSGMMAIAVPG